MENPSTSPRPARVRYLIIAASLFVISLVAATVLLVPHVTRTAHADTLNTATPVAGLGGAYHVTITSDATNTFGYILYINDPHLNNQSDLNLQVTQTWPNNYDPHPIGVWYDGNQWTIFNEDIQPIPLGTSFNVRSHIMQGLYIQLTASASNSNGALTYINTPAVNNDPNARIIVTQDWTGTYNPHDVGVYYVAQYGDWEVFNEDLAPIPIGATFHIMFVPSIALASYYVKTYQATAANIQFGYILYIDDPDLNWQPDLMLVAAQSQGNIGCNPCVYNPRAIGVWYDDSVGQWTVYNVDRTAMPVGAEFFVTGM